MPTREERQGLSSNGQTDADGRGGDGPVRSPWSAVNDDIPVAAAQAVRVEGSAPVAQTPTLKQTITVVLFAPGQAPALVDLAEMPSLVAEDDNFIWIDVDAYTEADLWAIAELLHLEPEAVRATLAPWHRPHLATHSAQAYVSVTVTELEPAALQVEARQLDLFLGRNYMVSAHKLPLPFAKRLCNRAWQSPDLVRLDAAYMLYLVLDELVGHVERLIEHLGNELAVLEERALRDTSDTFLADLARFKRYVVAVSRLNEQHREVFAAFLRPDWRFGDGEVRSYFRELDRRLALLLDALTAAKESVNGAFDIYVSHMAHRTNGIVRLLTIVSTLLLPTTVILGLFGTNFEGVPLYAPVGFFFMVAAIAVVTATILLAFRRLHWL